MVEDESGTAEQPLYYQIAYVPTPHTVYIYTIGRAMGSGQMALVKVVCTALHGFMSWELFYYWNLLKFCDIVSTFFTGELDFYRYATVQTTANLMASNADSRPCIHADPSHIWLAGAF